MVSQLSVVVVVVAVVVRCTDGADISLEAICGNNLVDSCPTRISLKVIGGTSTCAEKVPWNVLVEHASSKNKASEGGVYPYCGGVLVTDQHVVSAAHCFWTNENQFGTCPQKFRGYNHSACKREGCPASCSRLGPDDVRVYLGVSRRTEARPSDAREVSSIVLHPGWDRKKHLNDILSGHDLAVLRMKRRVGSYSRGIVPVCLPSPRDEYLFREGRSADVTGFGVVIEPVSGALKHPIELQTARVTLTSTPTCTNWWGIKGNQVCAAGTRKVESSAGLDLVADSCNGDSGGGLTSTNFNGREVLIGIVSFGETDCGRRGGKPGVYTNVLRHTDWLREQIEPRSIFSSGPQSPGTGIQCVASNGKQCRFPFKYRDKVFASCTTEFDPDGRPWCSTELGSDGQPGELGYCTKDCPTDILSTPSPPQTTTARPAPEVPWSQWSQCSVSCGSGSQTRRRTQQCNRNGESGRCRISQKQECNTGTCQTPFGGSSSPSKQWGAWGPCDKSCGVGTQIRTQVGTNIAQTRGCNTQSCPVSSISGRPSSQDSSCQLLRTDYDLGEDYLDYSSVRSLSTCKANCRRDSRCAGLTWVNNGRRNCALYDTAGVRVGTSARGQDSYTCGQSGSQQTPVSNSGSSSSFPTFSPSSSSSSTTWLLGGDNRLGRSVESISSSGNGLCGSPLSSLPESRASMMGGYLGGRVIACGGSTGGRSQTGVHTDCWASDPAFPSWQRIQSMPTNTSNAASAVAGGRLYVAGGYTQPLCGYRPEIQVYSPSTGWTNPSTLDPPNRVGAYSCAVAVGTDIYFIGGWYPPSVYTNGCREDRYEGAELTRVNREPSYYHNQVQVLDTVTGQWRQGPKLQTRRRNHGCALTKVRGRQGIIVAGGFNPQDKNLRSVEYLDLGSGSQRWRSLPDMSQARSDRLVLYSDSESVYAIGGNRGGSVEALNLANPRWRSVSSSVTSGRGHSLAVTGIPSSGGAQC